MIYKESTYEKPIVDSSRVHDLLCRSQSDDICSSNLLVNEDPIKIEFVGGSEVALIPKTCQNSVLTGIDAFGTERQFLSTEVKTIKTLNVETHTDSELNRTRKFYLVDGTTIKGKAIMINQKNMKIVVSKSRTVKPRTAKFLRLQKGRTEPTRLFAMKQLSAETAFHIRV